MNITVTSQKHAEMNGTGMKNTTVFKEGLIEPDKRIFHNVIDFCVPPALLLLPCEQHKFSNKP